jgi:hypothetical protein
MNTFKTVRRFSFVVMLIMTILMIFFKRNFTPNTFKIIAYTNGISIIITVLSKLLERREIKKYENKHH